MRRKSVFLEVVLRQFALAGRHHISSLPNYPSLPPALGERSAATSPAKRLRNRRGTFSNLVRTAALLLILVSHAFGAVSEVRSIGLTVDSLSRELTFYTNTLPFQLISIQDKSGSDEDALFGLPNVNIRVATLKLGDEFITLTEHLSDKGRRIPSDSRSFDHWFQHIAIVVSDMEKAYESLRFHKVRHISSVPQTLPDWNKNAGGVKAFYFRDPEDHALEIIWFPKGKGDPKWQTDTKQLFLGIDHTAIVVSDTDPSLAFYRDTLGMHVVGKSENYGVEQEHLNQVFGARLRITALRASKGPGIELLEYITPPSGRALGPDSKPNDLVFWFTHLVTDRLEDLGPTLRSNTVTFVSNILPLPEHSPKSNHVIFIRDPDGHALQLSESSEAISASVER
jgi:catechol 2,3-dioxygenase-like lactoylglutathione lyase family enzyme